MAHVDADVRSLKWKLWHGQTDRALDQLETMTSDFAKLRREAIFQRHACCIGVPLLTYVRSNKSAIINYGARYRSGRRIATALADRREFAGRTTNGQKAADAMVKAGRSSSTSGSGRRSQRRSSRAPRVQAAETSPSIEDRVAVRADTAAAQGGLTPQLIYRFRSRQDPATLSLA